MEMLSESHTASACVHSCLHVSGTDASTRYFDDDDDDDYDNDD
jgi:hypothetical protein